MGEAGLPVLQQGHKQTQRRCVPTFGLKGSVTCKRISRYKTSELGHRSALTCVLPSLMMLCVLMSVFPIVLGDECEGV